MRSRELVGLFAIPQFDPEEAEDPMGEDLRASGVLFRVISRLLAETWSQGMQLFGLRNDCWLFWGV